MLRLRCMLPRLLSVPAVALPLALAGCPVLQSQDTPAPEIRRVEPATGAEYYLYVPSTYTKDRVWSLAVTLHGTHRFDSAHAQIREWKALAEEHEFIVMAPQLNSPQGLLPLFRSHRLNTLAKDERKVLAAVAEVKREYHVADHDVMITGFSAGGFPLYYIGLRNPDVFRVLVARSCNLDMGIIRSIPITDKVRAMPMLINYGKTGINPVYSKFNIIAHDSWEVFRYLRENKCFKAEIKPVEGGHDRRPDVAWRFWTEHRPAPDP